jgi:hypothetical protein
MTANPKNMRVQSRLEKTARENALTVGYEAQAKIVREIEGSSVGQGSQREEKLGRLSFPSQLCIRLMWTASAEEACSASRIKAKLMLLRSRLTPLAEVASAGEQILFVEHVQ